MLLIIGCGYIGCQVADLVHAAGHPLVAVTHGEASADKLRVEKPYPVFSSDIGHLPSLQQLAGRLPSPPDAILHCASSNRGGVDQYRHVFFQGTFNLIDTFPASRLVFTSSTSVYPQTDGSWVTEHSAAEPGSASAQILRAAESLVLNLPNGCVARLAGIYGPGRSFVLKQFLEGAASIEGNDGRGRYLNQIHRIDAARALMHLIFNSLAGIFNVSDQHPMTQLDCYQELHRRFQLPLPPVTAPNQQRKRPWTHKRVSSARLHESGFHWQYPGYFDALSHDPDLIPSILAQLATPVHAIPIPRA